MDKIWMKEKMHRSFLVIQSRPFTLLILLAVVMSTILCITTPCFLVFASLVTATCVALQTGDFLGFVSRTGELQPGLHVCKESSVSSHIHAPQQNCAHVFSPPSTSWKYRLLQLVRQVSRSSAVFLKMHIGLSDLREEDLYGKGVEFEKRRIATEHLTDDSKRLKIHVGAKNGLLTDDLNHNESIVCTHRSVDTIISDRKVRPSCECRSHYQGEVGDVPELEDCSTSSEEEEVCKQVLETIVHASNSPGAVVEANAMFQLTNVSKAAMMCPSEDEHSIDKHQILPLEGCNQCKNIDICKVMAARYVPSGCNHNTYMDGKNLEITDADLQNSASEFFTLEGDVLWSETDIKKKLSGAGASVVPTTCEFCKQEGKISQSFAFFPLRTSTGAKTFAHAPASSKLVHYVDLCKRAQEDSSTEESIRASSEELNEDVMIDQELRAIASRSGNKGEESNYMSTAGSFRDYMGSFREFDTFWPDYDHISERKEDDYFVGCCDDHAKPCISHSRSRSKVLQTDPLLSKASLIREQEIMDVLWQEYNEDRRQKNNHLGKQQREIAQKQRSKLGTVDGSSSISEVLNEGSTAESFNVLQNDYVMKLNASADHEVQSCRFGYDKPCWPKARGYGQRRRHFVGFCRLFREFGLKQCMQSSKVDN
ncbi:hypothetical protein L7F22_056345 [Adiantum nelumboides]|nr:hypothetical protein [Adiantum nelumboides]